MHIVLIEDDHFEMEWFSEELKKAFPHIQIFLCRSVGEFLLFSQQLPTNYILITEHHLPLIQMGKNMEEMDAKLAELRSHFPWTGERWNHQEAGEQLVRHIRKTNQSLPIIIYTFSDETWIAEDVRCDPKVKYCEKESECSNLIKIIKSCMVAA